MTEQNDRTPAQEQTPEKTRKKNLYRIAVACLSLLLVTALLLVGGTFSKNASRGKVASSNFSINTAGFEVNISEADPPDGKLSDNVDLSTSPWNDNYNHQEAVCAFNIEGSGMPIYCDIELVIEVENHINNLIFYFFIDDKQMELTGQVNGGDGESPTV